MRILITGGAGFVGREFCRQLAPQGYEITIVDSIVENTGGQNPVETNWYNFDFRSFSNLKFIKADCRDFFRKTSPAKFDVVIHLAAIVGGRLVIERNPLAVAEDLDIDSQFWRWVTLSKNLKVISFSSSAAYPVSLQTLDFHRPLKEDDISFSGDIGLPDLTYGWAKLTSEYLGRLAHERHGIHVSCYRPFSGYGEDQDLNYPFPSIMQRAVLHDPKNQDDFQVWGSGLQERDFIHISDAVRMVLSTYEVIADGSGVNLGTGIATNFIELSKKALACLGHGDVKVLGMSDKPEGVFSRVSDTKYFSEKFSISNKIPIELGVEKGVGFFLRQNQKV